MGIPELLRFVDSAGQDAHISLWSGKRAAIDGYAWLHRGAKTCAMEMARGTPTTAFVEYCLRLLQMMRGHGVEPVVVFDGGPLVAKGGTESDRETKRQSARRLADELLRSGERQRALEQYARAVDVTPAHARQLQLALRKQRIRFYVAPYEADAQLAHLARAGHVDLVISEDSDMLAFGCPAVLFKMDSAGHGRLIERASLARATDAAKAGCVPMPLFSPWEVWDDGLFLDLCILAGAQPE